MAVRILMRLRVSDQSAHNAVAAQLEDVLAVVNEGRGVAVGVTGIKVGAASAEVAETVVAVIVKMTDAGQRV
jgi:hypothetical protein